MKKGRSISPASVDFWMDSDKYANLLDMSNPSSFSMDMIRLSSVRRAVANFVRILTRKNIPVYFNNEDANVNFGGKIIYLSANITNKREFDGAVGLALHEGAHTLKSDFDALKVAYANIPTDILTLADSKGIRRKSLEAFMRGIINVVEDRYIDTYIFNNAPGYRGYYAAMYEQVWNSPEVDMYLADPDLFRYPSLKSYDFRITNFTNPNTDLLALPRLDEIAKVMDISNILRLKRTTDRIKVGFDIVKIVLECLDDPSYQPKKKSSQASTINPDDFFPTDDTEENEGAPQKSNNDVFGNVPPTDEGNEKESKQSGESEAQSKDVGTQAIEEITDVLTDKSKTPVAPKENTPIVDQISDDTQLPKDVAKQIEKVIAAQKQFINGDIPKSELDAEQKEMLDLVEKHGIILVQIKVPELNPGNDTSMKLDCIVVQKMTKGLVFSGNEVFPLSQVEKVGDKIPTPPKYVSDAVEKGIRLGTKLGRKLQIRSEVNPVKVVRKRNGRINRRQLHEAAFDATDLFYKLNIEEFKDASIHITIDASSSMQGEKWSKTMTSLVAITKAASMIDNVHVTVSFRTTQKAGISLLPYIVLAYDSKVDKFSKVKSLFPFLEPNGMTPEGLAFSAIMSLFDNISPDEEQRYLVNISDGQPCFHYRIKGTNQVINYLGEVGVTHTKAQIDRIRRNEVEILSYFVDDGSVAMMKDHGYDLEHDFRKMYGKNAKFIDVESVSDLARTINDLLLNRIDENKS